jgi:ribosomal-protein-alanine N-acetyltransferase
LTRWLAYVAGREMSTTQIETRNLRLVAQTRDDVRAYLEQMRPDDKTEVSPNWLALLDKSSICDPWVHGFALVHRSSSAVIGRGGFKGPPTEDGIVEIAYAVSPEHQGNGYATEAAAALVNYALTHGQVRTVRAHTLPEANASTRVLTKCGFHRVGEVIDPEDGLVWRWEKLKLEHQPS